MAILDPAVQPYKRLHPVRLRVSVQPQVSRRPWAGESRLNLIAYCFRVPMQYRNLLVRMKICPSEIAGELSA